MSMSIFKKYKFLKEETRHCINIFDIDDTLVVTNSKIKITDTRDNKYFELTPKEFTTFKREPYYNLDFSDFVIAFVSAQDYLQQFKPNNSKPASIAQSIYIAQQFIEINAVSEEKNVDEIGVKLMDGMVDYLNKESNIKTLKIQ